MQPVDLIKEGINKVLPGRKSGDGKDQKETPENQTATSEEPMAEAEKRDENQGTQDEMSETTEKTETDASESDDEGDEEVVDFVVEVVDEIVEEQGGNDPITMLTMQHREVEVLFEAIENAGERAHRQKENLVQTLAEKLQLHMTIEEKVFYPGVRELDEELILESFEEHDAAKMVLAKLMRTKSSDESFDAKCSVLKNLIQQHVKEEESELFPKVRSSLGEDELTSLGDKMLRLVERGMARRAAPVRAASTRKKPSSGSKQRTSASRSSKKASSKAQKKAPASRGRSSSKKKSSGRR